jgi:hypothetical protein
VSAAKETGDFWDLIRAHIWQQLAKERSAGVDVPRIDNAGS